MNRVEDREGKPRVGGIGGIRHVGCLAFSPRAAILREHHARRTLAKVAGGRPFSLSATLGPSVPSLPPIFLVEDDSDTVRTITRLTRKTWSMQVAGTVQDALGSLEAGLTASAAIVDIGLPDGSGLDVLAALRQKCPRLPVLVLTAFVNVEFINRAQQLGAEYAVKPDYGSSLRAFLARVEERTCAAEARVRAHVEAFACARGLSPRETEVLRLAVGEMTRKEIAGALGVSLSAVKWWTQIILEKCPGESNLADLARRLRAEIREN